MIGERLKVARRIAGLSQRALGQEAGVSAMAISKYERDMDMPGSAVLLRLAEALGVKTEFFLRPITVTLSVPSYRRRSTLPRKQEYTILGSVQDWLERYIDVERFFGEPVGFTLPDTLDCRVNSLEEIEKVALDLREAWSLGQLPIEGFAEMLEDRGIKVGLVDGPDDFDSLTVWADSQIPVIIVKRGVPGDRQRFNLAHELGHLVLECLDGVDPEKAAYRFAGAFLVPEPVVRFELGEKRHTLGIYELHLLKHKYGLSMQGWIYRARDLGILSESSAARLFQRFRQQGWHREEPGDPFPSEEPERMKRLVMRALAEDMISESRAAELLGMSLTHFWEKEAKEHDGFPIGVCS